MLRYFGRQTSGCTIETDARSHAYSEAVGDVDPLGDETLTHNKQTPLMTFPAAAARRQHHPRFTCCLMCSCHQQVCSGFRLHQGDMFFFFYPQNILAVRASFALRRVPTGAEDNRVEVLSLGSVRNRLKKKTVSHCRVISSWVIKTCPLLGKEIWH